MQQGSFKVNGKYWWFKYREWVTENGAKVRKDRQVKLCLVDGYKPRQDGSAPDAVRAMVVKYLAPVNAGEATPLSADKLATFLENFLAKGEGGRGRKLEGSTLRNYEDLFKIAKPYLPNIELRRSQDRLRAPGRPGISWILRQISRGYAGLPRTRCSQAKMRLL